MTTAMIEKLEVLMNDEAFDERAASCGSIEEIRSLFEAEGIEFADNEWAAVQKKLNDAVDEEAGCELNVDELDGVVGGCKWAKNLWGHIKSFISGIWDAL